MVKAKGVLIHKVEPGSIADGLGLAVGCRIVEMNGFPVYDSLSFMFQAAQTPVHMQIRMPDGEMVSLHIDEEDAGDLGVELAEDPVRVCRNKCIFCFVDQNHPHHRPSLKLKDEDIRLSFLFGNYTTLSNVDRDEEARIVREKLSPLYVSVHATHPATRVYLLGNRHAGDILDRLERLAHRGISFHAQIVLCPGINDGEILDRTLVDLASLGPQLLSIAVVPVGLTRHRTCPVPLSPATDDMCRETIVQVETYQRRFMKEIGLPLVYLADEFYLRAGKRLPSQKHYAGFPQYDNGVGMVRDFVDRFKRSRVAPPRSKARATLVTGMLFAPVLQELVAGLCKSWGIGLEVRAVRNQALGAETITVAGLLHGKDIRDQLTARDCGDFAVIPDVMVRSRDEPIFLDDWHVQDLADALKCPIWLADRDASQFHRGIKRVLNALTRKNPEVLPEWYSPRSGVSSRISDPEKKGQAKP